MKVQIDDKHWIDLKVMAEHARCMGRRKSSQVLADTVGKGPVTVQTNLRVNRAIRHRLKWLAGKLNMSESKVVEAAILLLDPAKYVEVFIDTD